LLGDAVVKGVGGLGPFSFCIQTTFWYEQQVHCVQETVFRCLQTPQMQEGISSAL